MQIHELNNFNGSLGSGSYVAVDNGADTGKLSIEQLLAETEQHISNAEDTLNARIDNIIAGGSAPSAAEVTDARLGASILGNELYPSLGDAIRGQVTVICENDSRLEDDALGIVTPYKVTGSATSTGQTYPWENFTFLRGTRLKKGCKYSISMVADQIATGNIYISIKKPDGTNATTCHISANTSSKTIEYTAPDNMIVYAYLEINLSTVYTITGTIEKLNVDKNVVQQVYKKANAADLKPVIFSEYKNSMGFAVGELNNGVIGSWPYRISSDQVYKFDFPIYVSMDNTHRFGVCYFADASDSSYQDWTGWMDEEIIPAHSFFKLQCARKTDETSSIIVDPYDNDIYDALHIVPLESDILDNPLKIASHNDTRLWEQGACAVGNKYIGFRASNDDHTNTAAAWIGTIGDFTNQVTIQHNLGHCASADYNEIFDTILVANGTSTPGVDPTIFLIRNGKAVVNQGLDIDINDNNVTEIPLTNINGEGAVACFGESNNIVYVITSEDSYNFDTSKTRYIYKIALGVTSDVFDGSYTILKSYDCEFYGELQGLKYLNGKLLLPMDFTYKSLLTSFIMLIKVTESDAVIMKQCWIPVTDNGGARLRTECEDMIIYGSDAYVMTFSSAITNWAAHKFSLLLMD